MDEVFIVTKSNRFFNNPEIWRVYSVLKDAIEGILSDGDISEEEMENTFGSINRVWNYIEEHLCTPDFSVNYRIEQLKIIKPIWHEY